MALTLSEKQQAKLNKKDIFQLLLESMHNEEELCGQLAVFPEVLKRAIQQMQYAERIIEAENMIDGNVPEEPAMEAVAVSVHKRKST